MHKTIPEAVGFSDYPGRGIIIAKCDAKIFMAYFIMGRSENSRNRVFEETSGGIRTKAFVPSKLSDPTLVIYNPVRFLGNDIIISNGDQTDTIYEFMKWNKSFYEALETRTFEPDYPNFTPRISALVRGENVTLSVIRSLDGLGGRAVRSYFNYESIMDGEGYFIHTYKQCVPTLASFAGEPERVSFSGDLYDFYSQVWDNLNFDNRISLWVAEYCPQTGMLKSAIANKNTGEFTALDARQLKGDK